MSILKKLATREEVEKYNEELKSGQRELIQLPEDMLDEVNGGLILERTVTDNKNGGITFNRYFVFDDNGKGGWAYSSYEDACFYAEMNGWSTRTIYDDVVWD